MGNTEGVSELRALGGKNHDGVQNRIPWGHTGGDYEFSQAGMMPVLEKVLEKWQSPACLL